MAIWSTSIETLQVNCLLQRLSVLAPHDMDTSQPQTNHGTQTLSDNLTTSQRRPMKKALSIAIQYHELSLYWEEPALELPNAHKDLAVIRELLTGLQPALTSSDHVSLIFSCWLDRYGYEYENIRTLWDNPEDETRSSWPTMANIVSKQTTSNQSLDYSFDAVFCTRCQL